MASTTTTPVVHDPYRSRPVSTEWARVMRLVRQLAAPRAAVAAPRITYFI